MKQAQTVLQKLIDGKRVDLPELIDAHAELTVQIMERQSAKKAQEQRAVALPLLFVAAFLVIISFAAGCAPDPAQAQRLAQRRAFCIDSEQFPGTQWRLTDAGWHVTLHNQPPCPAYAQEVNK
jgi:hypothetical protein